MVILDCQCGECVIKVGKQRKSACCPCNCDCGRCAFGVTIYDIVPSCCPCAPCFPGEASVSLENGKSLTMSELQIGDKVQTGKCKCFL